MNKKIYEPILVYFKDTGEFRKYSTICSAEIELECYDIDNYEVYDSQYRILEICPSQNGGVVLKLIDHEKTFDNKIIEYACNEIKAIATHNNEKNNFLDVLIGLLPNIKHNC